MANVYNPVGTCIYCGSTTAPLGKEHFIALGLNGEGVSLQKKITVLYSRRSFADAGGVPIYPSTM